MLSAVIFLFSGMYEPAQNIPRTLITIPNHTYPSFDTSKPLIHNLNPKVGKNDWYFSRKVERKRAKLWKTQNKMWELCKIVHQHAISHILLWFFMFRRLIWLDFGFSFKRSMLINLSKGHKMFNKRAYTCTNIDVTAYPCTYTLFE